MEKGSLRVVGFACLEGMRRKRRGEDDEGEKRPEECNKLPSLLFLPSFCLEAKGD